MIPRSKHYIQYHIAPKHEMPNHMVVGVSVDIVIAVAILIITSVDGSMAVWLPGLAAWLVSCVCVVCPFSFLFGRL